MARAARDRVRGDTAVIAIGKAALPMLAGARAVLGAQCVRAFAVTSDAAAAVDADPPTQICVGDHPVPGPRSLAAGEALDQFLAALPADLPVWVLVSGGASSLVEQPLPGVTLADVQALTEWALARDVPIATLNGLRRRLSALKDGRLAARLAHRPAQAFVLSDVPGDDPSVVGSGLVAMSPGAETPLPADLPDALRRCFERIDAPRGATLPTVLVGSLAQALAAVDTEARAEGYTVEHWPTRVEGLAVAAGRDLAAWLAHGTADLLVAGGDALYLAHWMRLSGMVDLLPSLTDTVWVGLSAGSMVMTPRIGEDFVGWKPPGGGDATLGLVDFAIFPHLDHPDLPENTLADAKRWAGTIGHPAYGIDDETAIKVVDGVVEVISEGHWTQINP